MAKTILIVDDKPEIAQIVKLYLSNLYDMHYFENPALAIPWLEEGNIPDAIISDLNMPQMNGEDFVVYLKSSNRYREIPILVLSSVYSNSDRNRLFEEGVNDFILKPFNPEELKMRIKVLVR